MSWKLLARRSWTTRCGTPDSRTGEFNRSGRASRTTSGCPAHNNLPAGTRTGRQRTGSPRISLQGEDPSGPNSAPSSQPGQLLSRIAAPQRELKLNSYDAASRTKTFKKQKLLAEFPSGPANNKTLEIVGIRRDRPPDVVGISVECPTSRLAMLPMIQLDSGRGQSPVRSCPPGGTHARAESSGRRSVGSAVPSGRIGDRCPTVARLRTYRFDRLASESAN